MRDKVKKPRRSSILWNHAPISFNMPDYEQGFAQVNAAFFERKCYVR